MSLAKPIATQPVTSVLPPTSDVPLSSEAYSEDEEVLAALGYKSEFKREFGLFTTFCVSFAVLGLLPSFASTLFYGMGYAGTAVNYGTAAMILAAASIQSPTYTPTNYQTFLLTTLIMLIHGLMSSLPTKLLAQINTIGSTFNILALIVVLILIPAGTDRPDRGLPRFTSSSEVWGTIYEGTAFPPGISVLMSFVAVIWTMSGYDSPFHLAEECSNANIASPRAIVLTSAVGGTFGWFLQLVVAYTVVNIDDVLESDLGQPFAAYLIQCMPQKMVLAILTFTTPIFIRVFFVGDRFRPGPWNLGRFSMPIGTIASAFVLLMVPILCFPSVRGEELTPELMNWTCLVYGGPMFMVTVWWFVSAKKWFKGPKVNVDHLMLGREGNVVEGTPKDREIESEREDGAGLIGSDKGKILK
ncbi:hypothetical protein GRF29_77g117046 [Pseudopithomyces chartarum]|uniref:Uncharacterized protein n=1 Tax=Pseudopithomyces chartarum TaxID=1892770 RepID=A0AAN6RG72_9PLEO|nr:hypothetical protein GRF29_77g117046 [Pseudopithomyces chartarum]